MEWGSSGQAGHCRTQSVVTLESSGGSGLATLVELTASAQGAASEMTGGAGRCSKSGRRRTIIFGGFGMQPGHCAKLANIYRKDHGNDVVALCHSLHEMTIPRIGRRRARQLAEKINRYDDGDLTVHLYSGAVFIFGCLLPLLNDKVRESIRAVIFESSPMDCRAEQFGRFLSWRLGREYTPKYAAPFVALRPMVGITRRFQVRHRHERLLLPSHARVHFIQCANDPIIDSDYVETYRQELEARGHITSLTTHRDARHCRALSDCPADYRADLEGLFDTLWPAEISGVADTSRGMVGLRGT